MRAALPSSTTPYGTNSSVFTFSLHSGRPAHGRAHARNDHILSSEIRLSSPTSSGTLVLAAQTCRHAGDGQWLVQKPTTGAAQAQRRALQLMQ